jgi:hypothetical protein
MVQQTPASLIAECHGEEIIVEHTKLHRLACNICMARADVGQHVNGLHGSPPRDKGERVDTLVAKFGRQHMGGDRVRERGQLGHVGGNVDVDALHGKVSRVDGAQVGRQPVVCGRVDELSHLRKEDAADHLESKAGLVHGGGDGCGLEVAARKHVTSVIAVAVVAVASGQVAIVIIVFAPHDQWVVGRRVELGLDLAFSQDEVFEIRPEPLGGGAGRVAVLPQTVASASAVAESDHEARAAQEPAQVGGGLALARVRTAAVDKVVGPLYICAEAFGRERRQHLGQDSELVGLVECEAGECCRRRSAVDKAEGFLGLELEGRADARVILGPLRPVLGRRQDAAAVELDEDVRIARQRAGNVGKGLQIARRRNSTAQWDDGGSAITQHVEKALNHGQAHSTVAAQVLIGTHEHGGANPVARDGVAPSLQRIGALTGGDNAALLVLQQGKLQVSHGIPRGRVGAHISATPVARVDAVDGPSAVKVAVEHANAPSKAGL